jgi:hypothetical protein
VLCDDDSGAGLGSRLYWQAPANGRYYVRAYDFDASRGGDAASYRLVVTANASMCDADAFEPDDHYALAKDTVLDGTAQVHTICQGGDEDWLRLWVQAPGIYDMRIDAVGADADPAVTLYDLDGQTPLWSNDDYGPGTSARVLWRFMRSGVYFLKVVAFDGQNAGRGTEYAVRIAPSQEVPTPTPTLSPTPTHTPLPTPTPTATPTPGWPIALPTPNGVPDTLIVTNRQRMQMFYGETRANMVMGRVAQLMADPQVRGLLLNLDADANLTQAYARWQGNLASVDVANRVTDMIRTAIWTQLGQHPTIQQIVIVGDDRVIPYRRERDNMKVLGTYAEKNYAGVSGGSTVGMALQANASLTDDFYAMAQPRRLAGRPFYLPDKVIARLVETPEQIIAMIDRFFGYTSPPFEYQLAIDNSVLVVGGTNSQQSTVSNLCAHLGPILTSQLNCTLNGATWGQSAFTDLHLRADAPFQFHVLHVAGDHWQIRQGDRNGFIATATISASGVRFARGVVATTMPHGGLNVPPEEMYAQDWPETYLAIAEVFIGSTGNTFFMPDAKEESYSGKLLNLFAKQLYALPSIDATPTIGEAWQRAKHLYAQQMRNPNEFDRKILHVATFYGLPMYLLPAGLGDPDPYPSVRVNQAPIRGATANAPAITSLGLTLEQGTASLSLTTTQQGDYFALDGAAGWSLGAPVQPYYAGDLRRILDSAATNARGVIWTGGVYSDVAAFTPVVPKVVTNGEDGVVIAADVAPGTLDAAPMLAQLDAANQQLVVDWGQFDAPGQRQRIYGELDFEVIYSDSPDQIPAEVSLARGQAASMLPWVKVEASDASGVQRVVVTYTNNRGQFESMDLVYQPAMQKWVGQLPVLSSTAWLAQVMDGAGNVTLVTSKGSYFEAGQGSTLYWQYLPTIKR